MTRTEPTRIVWRRLHSLHDYVGMLAATDAGLRLEGREPSTGIELSLSIPFSEIEQVSAANGSCSVAGEPAVVLELAGSEPVLLREVGPAPRPSGTLAQELSHLRRASPASRAAPARWRSGRGRRGSRGAASA